MKTPEQSAKHEQKKENRKEFLLLEYANLRNEITSRTGNQLQIISLTIVATGTFLVMESTLTKLFYPVLALFLAIAWKHNDHRIGQLGRYIKDFIEVKYADGGWEHYYKKEKDTPIIGSLAHFSSRGIICGSQIFVVIIAKLLGELTLIENTLFIFDCLVVVLTLLLLSPWPWKKLKQKPHRF